MSSSTNNWGLRRIEHRLYGEIVADITTQKLNMRKYTHKKHIKT